MNESITQKNVVFFSQEIGEPGNDSYDIRYFASLKNSGVNLKVKTSKSLHAFFYKKVSIRLINKVVLVIKTFLSKP